VLEASAVEPVLEVLRVASFHFVVEHAEEKLERVEVFLRGLLEAEIERLKHRAELEPLQHGNEIVSSSHGCPLGGEELGDVAREARVRRKIHRQIRGERIEVERLPQDLSDAPVGADPEVPCTSRGVVRAIARMLLEEHDDPLHRAERVHGVGEREDLADKEADVVAERDRATDSEVATAVSVTDAFGGEVSVVRAAHARTAAVVHRDDEIVDVDDDFVRRRAHPRVLAGQRVGHRVEPFVEGDVAVPVDTSGFHRTGTYGCAGSGCSAACSSDSKTSSGRRCVVPWIRSPATTSIQCASCRFASSTSRPSGSVARKLFATYFTLASTSPSFRVRAAGSGR
jgi:hypothetical protein